MARWTYEEFKKVMDQRWADMASQISLFTAAVLIGDDKTAGTRRGDVHDALDRLLDATNEQHKPQR